MPFTGTGTGIANANDTFFSGVAQGDMLQYNSTTSKWNNSPLNIQSTHLSDDAVTEPKLAIANTPTSSHVLSWNGAAMAWVAQATASDATTLAKGVVQLAGDLGGTAAAPTVPGLAAKANASTTYSKTEVDTAIGGKVSQSVLSAKGALLTATAANTPSGLPVGTDGDVLTVDSAQATGLKWAAAPSAPVSSVVSQTGDVTGDQIANDPALVSAFATTIVSSQSVGLTVTVRSFTVGSYSHPGGTVTALPSGAWYVGTDLFTGNILTLPRLGHRGWIPLARITTDATKVTSITQIAPHMPTCRIPRTIEKIKKGQVVNVVAMGSSLIAGGGTTDWSGMVFNGASQAADYYVPNTVLNNVGVGGSPNQYQLAQLGYAAGHTGAGYWSSGYPTVFGNKLPPNGRSQIFENVDLVVLGCLANGGEYRLEIIEPIVRKLRAQGIEVILTTDNPQGPGATYATMLDAGLYSDGATVIAIADLYGVELADTAAYVFEAHLRAPGTIYADGIHMLTGTPAGRNVAPGCGHEVWARAIRSLITLDTGSGTSTPVASYDFSTGQGSWFAYGTPASIDVVAGKLVCVTDSSFDGAMIGIGNISTGDIIRAEFDIEVGAGLEVQVGILNGVWAGNGGMTAQSTGHYVATMSATQTASMTLGFINFGTAGTFSLDNVVITKTLAADTTSDTVPGRAVETKALPPIRMVSDYRTPADSFIILPKDELMMAGVAPERGTLAAHPWGSGSFQRKFVGGAGGDDLLVLATGKECLMGAQGVVGWSIIRYAEPADGSVTIDISQNGTVQNTITLGAMPFANEWYHTIIAPTEYNAATAAETASSSIKLTVTSGTLKIAAIVALTADVSFISPEEISYVGTWGGRENSRSDLPGYWTDTVGSFATVRCPGNRLQWLVSSNPGTKLVDMYAANSMIAGHDASGNYHVAPIGGLTGKDVIHTIRCAEANPAGSQANGHSLHIGGAIVYNDR